MSWIYLNKEKHPTKQNSTCSYFETVKKDIHFVGLKKEYEFDKSIKKIELSFAYDTTGYLYCNDQLVSGTNNKCCEEFLTIDRKVPQIYINIYNHEFSEVVTTLNFVSKIAVGALKMWDFSSGQGGFYLKGKVFFEDESVVEIESDESWLIREENQFVKPGVYDNTIKECEYENASILEDNWQILDTDIKIPLETEIRFDNCFVVNGKERKTFKVDFPLIYSAYYIIEVKTSGLVNAKLITKEKKNYISSEHLLKFNHSDKVRLFEMVSCGGFELKVNNKGLEPAEIIIHVMHSKYPYENSYDLETNNTRLNDLFMKCKYAVDNCSQTIYLDSPKHLEPLASCSGDYNIESLVNAFSSGDYSLSKHHLRGYARYMVRNEGINANTSYALTFVKWLKNMYMFTGDKTLLEDCLEGVKIAINKYISYLGENNLVETPRNYVFLDWLFVDGINLFSPSKNLGQSVATITLYDSIRCAEFIYNELGLNKESKKLHSIANKIKKAVNTLLFNNEKGLYCEGLTTPNIPNDKYVYVPDNFEKIYYRKHANILAVAYDVANKSTSKKILHKLFFGEIKDLEVQPFFLHHMFEAIHHVDMDKKYTMKVIKQYLRYVKVKDKGLPEGFFPPSPTYVFDNSHAWAATPYYSFIMASSGLKILEPGMKKIRLKPTYLGVDVNYVIPTQFGNITFEHKKGQEAKIDIPNGIEVIYE